MRRYLLVLAALLPILSAIGWAESAEWTLAHELYLRTEYRASLEVLLPFDGKDAAATQLIGQDYFQLGEYRKASESLERAASLAPDHPDCLLWLGRAYGRRAETSGPFTSPGYAAKARQMFERVVALDPSNREAVGDLFAYYLEAPGFLGGGQSKAEALAARVAQKDPAEGHYYQAQIDDRRKQFDSAEQHLRTALALAPRQVGRFIDLAKFLGARGRAKESDAFFEEAERLAPDSPRVLYERAASYIKNGRNLDEARLLLRRYLRAPLTPSDPPRSQAEALLKKIGA